MSLCMCFIPVFTFQFEEDQGTLPVGEEGSSGFWGQGEDLCPGSIQGIVYSVSPHIP